MLTRENVADVLAYQLPTGEATLKYGEIRESAYLFAVTILRLTPVGSDQQAALRKVREAVMTANAAIALSNIQY